MLKFYRPQIEQLLICAVHQRDVAGYTLQTLSHHLRSSSLNAGLPSGSTDSRILQSARQSVTADDNLNDLIDLLLKKLKEETSGRGEADLIDQIVATLQLPFARNVLAGENLRYLRQAILLPSELSGLMGRLRARELSCAKCGLPLHDGEAVTLQVSGETSQPAFMCSRCQVPETTACVSCDHVTEFSSKARSALSKMQCAACAELKREKLKLEEDLPRTIANNARMTASSWRDFVNTTPPTTQPDTFTVPADLRGIEPRGGRG